MHLKYNKFVESIQNSYEPLTVGEFHDFCSGKKPEKLSNREMNILKSHIPYLREYNFHHNDLAYSNYTSISPNEETEFWIRKFYDEWYILSIVNDRIEKNNEFYRCDQFDGLLNILKKYLSKNKLSESKKEYDDYNKKYTIITAEECDELLEKKLLN